MSTSATPNPLSQADQDAQHLASLGYRQELRRTLGFFSNFAVAFSYISVSTGTFALFGLGIATGGPAFFWSWPLVALGQFLVALNFAELASHYPIAGSVYQWTKRLASPMAGWFTGWFYLAATLLTVTSVAFTLPVTLTVIFGWPADAPTEVKITLVTLVVTTAINVAGVRLVSFINNIGVIAEILGMVVFALILLVVGHHQPLGVFTNTAGTEHTPGAGAGYLGVFASAMFMSLYVIYGFDTAGTLGEETINPTRQAPRGVLWSIGLSFIAGVIFLGAALLAIKNVPAIVKTPAANWTTILPNIITSALGTTWGNVYLLVVSVAIFVCTLAIQAAAIRLMFSMGRDGRLPFSNLWGSVHPSFGTPAWTGLATGVLAAIPLFVNQQIAVIVAGATGLIYLSYFMTNIVILQARMRGWPQQRAWFNLGRWAMPINILALVYGGSMLINFAWFRPDLTNPTLGSAFSGLANWPLIGNAPLFELTVGLLLFIGGVYWFAVQRRRVETRQAPAAPETSGSGMRPAR